MIFRKFSFILLSISLLSLGNLDARGGGGHEAQHRNAAAAHHHRNTNNMHAHPAARAATRDAAFRNGAAVAPLAPTVVAPIAPAVVEPVQTEVVPVNTNQTSAQPN